MIRTTEALAIAMIQERYDRSYFSELFLVAVKEGFDLSKKDKSQTPLLKDEMLNQIQSDIIDNIFQLNKFLFNKDIHVSLAKNVFEKHMPEFKIILESEIVQPEFFEPNINLTTNIQDKIIEHVRRQISHFENKFPSKTNTLKYDDYIKVDINITVKPRIKDENGDFHCFDNVSSFSFERNNLKEVKDNPIPLDKVCFAILLISNWVKNILKSFCIEKTNDIKKHNEFILLLTKILFIYSDSIANNMKVNAAGNIETSSYLDKSGKRLSNFKKRLKVILTNSHNERFPLVIAANFELYDSFREIRLELGLPVQEALTAIKYNLSPVDLEANKSKSFKDR
jgi:hypothetical protein